MVVVVDGVPVIKVEERHHEISCFIGFADSAGVTETPSSPSSSSSTRGLSHRPSAGPLAVHPSSDMSFPLSPWRSRGSPSLGPRGNVHGLLLVSLGLEGDSVEGRGNSPLFLLSTSSLFPLLLRGGRESYLNFICHPIDSPPN